MRGLLIAVVSMTLAATAGFAQVRGGFRGGARVAARPSIGVGVRGRAFVAPGLFVRGGFYPGYRFGVGVGIGLPYAAPCYAPYGYCGYPYPYPAYGYVAPRVVVPPVVVGGGWRHFRR